MNRCSLPRAKPRPENACRRFRGLKPSTPGNSACRSRASRSIILPPLLGRKPLAKVPADRPIEEGELPADGKSGPHLGGPNAPFQILNEFVIARGKLEAFGRENRIPRRRMVTFSAS
jgi:hypothetical protein